MATGDELRQGVAAGDELRQGVAAGDELRTLALDLKGFLVKYHRVTDVVGPQPISPDWRNWEISFVHRGERRHYVYHMQRRDPLATMFQALRADTTGELLVRIPDLQGDGPLLTNEIYYPPHG